MMNRRWTLFVLACCVLIPSTACRQGTEMFSSSKEMRILWVGSSSTYYHDMPDQLARWISETTDCPAQSQMVGKGGTPIHLYLEPEFEADYGLEGGQTVLEKIRTGDYDFVVEDSWISISPAHGARHLAKVKFRRVLVDTGGQVWLLTAHPAFHLQAEQAQIVNSVFPKRGLAPQTEMSDIVALPVELDPE